MERQEKISLDPLTSLRRDLLSGPFQPLITRTICLTIRKGGNIQTLIIKEIKHDISPKIAKILLQLKHQWAFKNIIFSGCNY